MKRVLGLATAMVLLFAGGGQAATFNLGNNPDAGILANNNLPTGAFADQWFFDLINASNFITIAGVQNTFAAGASQKINTFAAGIFNFGANNIAEGGLGDDVAVIGPVFATVGCGIASSICQSLAGTATLGAGSYYANITGLAGVNAGYGGILSVAAVPIPAALPLFGTALGGLLLLRKKRNAATTA